MDTVYTIHSYLRWLVALTLVLALIRTAMIWLRKGQFTGADRGIISATVGLMDLQLLLGAIMLFGWGIHLPAERFRLEHAVIILIGLIIAHMTARYKKLDGPVRARKTFISLLIAAILIFVGVYRLPGNGWTRWMNRGTETVVMNAPAR
ncbi:MAG: hypothetical protein ABIQ57_11145 [Candidatus Kapaibacterium sp.]